MTCLQTLRPAALRQPGLIEKRISLALVPNMAKPLLEYFQNASQLRQDLLAST
jgi:hypothetical protein